MNFLTRLLESRPAGTLRTVLAAATLMGLALALPAAQAQTASSAQLTVSSGVVVKFGPGAGLLVRDRLNTGAGVTFTSLADDQTGGQVQASPGSPQRGDWLGLFITGGVPPQNLNINGLALRYSGGSAGLPANLNGGAALVLGGDSYSFSNLQVTNSVAGVRVIGAGTPTFTQSVLSQNATGLLAEQGATPSIETSDLSANSDYGVRNANPATVVRAQGNWWGDASGPRDPVANPGGQGSAVSTGVDYGQYLQAQPVLTCTMEPTAGYLTRVRAIELRLNCPQAAQYRISEQNQFNAEPWLDMQGVPTLATFTLSVEPGNKMLYVQFRTAQGSTNIFALAQPIGYAPNGPLVSIDQPDAGAVLTQDTLVVITATDPDGVKQVELLLDNQHLAFFDAPPYRYTLALASVPNGSHTLTARATGLSNVTNTATRTVVVQKEGTGATTLEVTFGGAPLVANATITQPGQLAVTAQNPAGITRIQASVDTVQLLNQTYNKTSPATASQFLGYDTLTLLANGAHNLTVQATDADGITSTTVIPFTLTLGALTAPIITTPQTGATVGTSVVNVSGSADPGASVQVYVDGTPAGTPVTVAAGGNFSVTVDLGSEGTHTLTAKASVAGITGPQSNQVSITLVIGAPTIIITSPAEGASLAANTLISASVTDLTGIAQVQFLANDQLIGTSTNAPWSVTWAVTAVPDGPYTLKAIATNTAGKTAQATRTVQVQKNPAAPTAPPPPYSTQGVTATPSLSWGESPIQIQGQAIDTSGQPAPGATFTMILRVQGAERRITLQTDTSGQFNYTFYPQASDAGTYQIYVVAPGVTPAATEAPQASFTINRLTVNTSQYTLNALRGIPAAVPLQVTASPGSGATNVHWEILPADQPSGSLPPGITLDLGQPANIAAGTTAPLNVTFTGSTGTGAGGTIILTLMAQESGSAARAKLRIDYRLYDAQPGLTPNPATLQLGVQQNQRVSGAITITNKGLAPAQNVTVALQARGGGQAPSWAHLESAPAIGALDVGQNTIIQISAQPGTDVQDGYYQLELKVTASNDPGGTVPVTIAVAQAGQGGIDFKLVDIYTGTLNEQGQPIQGLQGARIVLQNDALTGTIYTATSDDQGIAHFTNLPPGNYTWRASAPNHMDAGGRTTVYANLTASERVFLDYQLISIQFSVTETTIQDVYDIVLTATFQTQVPAPVVLIEPLSVNLPDMQQGEQITGQFTVTNYGLVRADNLRIALPASDDNYGYEFFGTLPTQLQAKQRITIPYRITARQALNKSLTVNLTPQKQIEQIPGVKNQPGVQVQNAIRDFLGKGDTSGLDPSTPQAVQIRAAKAATCSSYQTQICESHDYDCAAGDNRQGASCASISRVTGSCSNEIVIPGDTVTGPRRPGGEGGGWGGGGGGGTPIGLAPSCTPPCPDCEKGGGSR